MPTGTASFIEDQDENVAKVTRRGHIFESETYDLIKVPSTIRLTSDSGGSELPTVDIGKMIIRSWSGNNVIFVGGVAEDAPYSGRGIPVWANETFTVPVHNMNSVRAFAATSGNLISVMGFGIADNVNIPTNDPQFFDTTPPSLVSVTPTDGATGIETDLQEITATFDRALLSGSVNTSSSSFTVRLSGGSTLLSGLAFVDTDSTLVGVFAPKSGQLQNSLIYTARVGGAIKNLSGHALAVTGSWSFTTAAAPPPPDTTRPKVSGFVPVSGATSVAIATSPTVTMSEQILSGTASSGFFSLRLAGGTVVSNSVQLSPSDNKTVTLAVSGGNLGFSGVYFMIVTSGVKDLAGNNMSGNVSGTFRTLGVTLPRVSGSDPVSGAVDVSVGVSPTVTWDRAIQSGFVNATYFDIHLSGTSTEVARSFSIDPTFKIVTQNPTNDLTQSQSYEIEVQSGVKDLSGNAFSGTFTAFFRTESPTYNIVYNVTHSSTANQLFDSDDTVDAMEVHTSSSAMMGLRIAQVRVTLRKVGNPTGDIACVQIDSAGNTLVRVGDFLDASTLTTSYADYTFTETEATINTTPLTVGQKIGIEYEGGDSSNYVEIRRNGSDVFDGADTIRTIKKSDGDFDDQLTQDFAAIMWTLE